MISTYPYGLAYKTKLNINALFAKFVILVDLSQVANTMPSSPVWLKKLILVKKIVDKIINTKCLLFFITFTHHNHQHPNPPVLNLPVYTPWQREEL